jgi:NADPH:quinone reductase-like Zn-dependent oxidoreductase
VGRQRLTVETIVRRLRQAEVTAVCSGKHVGFVRSLGADYIIDYKTEDFRERNKKYDLVLGVAGAHVSAAGKRY